MVCCAEVNPTLNTQKPQNRRTLFPPPPPRETSPSAYGGKCSLLVCLLVCSNYSHSYGAHPWSICIPTGARSGFLGEAPSLFSNSALEMSAKGGINPPAACSAPLRDRSLLPSQDTSTQEHKIVK